MTQEVFLRLVRERSRYRPGCLFLPWAYTIARNLLISHRRKKNSEQRAIVQYESKRIVATHDESCSSDERESLWQALRQLDTADRELLIQARFEELPYPELAVQVGISVGALKVRVFRAMEKLRAVMQRMQRS